jgi:general secretion pathway protein D
MDVAVAAAASDSRINVIQKPRILTSHATPGQIFVGQTVPYITSTYYGGGFNGGPSSQYQQLSVGIGLQVTPYINPDGLVVMQIDETIDELAGSTDIAGVGAVPNTTHRTLSAEVACRDGDTIILGGFIRNSSNKTSSGVPLLKDIPLLGYLFSSRSDSKERSELLVLMRPTVLKTPEIAALTTTQEKNRMPGVSHAEKENNELEKKLLERERTHQSKYENAPLKDIDKETTNP